ncbi:hypothetical protein HMPREF9123_1201 [Neisseria bacilliformis ATCC BAA-1200]|uniref:Uncharacterized protein n=1 Tax=Neisseria bacilliformis ATCC BAA-1200 TaxID=888742 RepID=F2BBU6_9NEIS|nr:hypothetical protein HMPREF9123_1201 [Neisseria bacilliformis ATCC BAA-1200]
MPVLGFQTASVVDVGCVAQPRTRFGLWGKRADLLGGGECVRRLGATHPTLGSAWVDGIGRLNGKERARRRAAHPASRAASAWSARCLRLHRGTIKPAPHCQTLRFYVKMALILNLAPSPPLRGRGFLCCSGCVAAAFPLC